MTDNEIIKALENCLYYSPSCTICKYDADTLTSSECIGALMKDSLDPINRQKAEIERLKLECYKLYSKGSAYSMQVEASDRIEHQIKSEAIKEFAEKLKKRFYLSAGRCVVDVYHIDNLVKEMTE